jgi:hypothetical protein
MSLSSDSLCSTLGFPLVLCFSSLAIRLERV